MSQQYRVTSKHAVLGHAPGVVFEAYLTDVQAARLVVSGALAPVAEPATTPDAPPEA